VTDGAVEMKSAMVGAVLLASGLVIGHQDDDARKQAQVAECSSDCHQDEGSQKGLLLLASADNCD